MHRIHICLQVAAAILIFCNKIGYFSVGFILNSNKMLKYRTPLIIFLILFAMAIIICSKFSCVLMLVTSLSVMLLAPCGSLAV